jgi:integrase
VSLVFDQYSERLRRKRKSPHTLRGFAVAATQLDRWLAQQGLTADDVDYETLESYFDTMPHAPSTRGTHLRFIQAAYNYGVRRGTIRRNPALDIEVEQPADKEPRIIPTSTLREIRDGIMCERDWIFFHLLTYTGMRRSEIRGLVWNDDITEDRSVLRLEDQTIRVLGKGGKLRLVPVHPALGEELLKSRRLPGRFVVPSDGANGVALETIQAMVKRLHPVFTPHDYRRTVATSLARNETPERVIDKIMGWSQRSVRDRYYVNVAERELHSGILRLYADDPM